MILMQWMMTCSLLSFFDLSKVPLFSWSDERLQVEAGAENEDEDVEAEGGDWNMIAQFSARRSDDPDPPQGGLVVETTPGADSQISADDDIIKEPAEQYYRRLYDEYRQARTNLGDPDSATTYVRFIENVGRCERELKQELDVSHVRFVVKERDGEIVLSPVIVP